MPSAETLVIFCASASALSGGVAAVLASNRAKMRQAVADAKATSDKVVTMVALHNLPLSTALAPDSLAASLAHNNRIRREIIESEIALAHRVKLEAIANEAEIQYGRQLNLFSYIAAASMLSAGFFAGATEYWAPSITLAIVAIANIALMASRSIMAESPRRDNLQITVGGESVMIESGARYADAMRKLVALLENPPPSLPPSPIENGGTSEAER